MNVLYKYLTLLPTSYFDNPTIKISIPHLLNDPFESSPSHNIYESIKKIRLSLGFDEKTAGYHADLYRETISNRLELNGVVSFSETPRNSLMWAHYGDHHKGMCIGFKTNMFDGLHTNNNHFEMPVLTPMKVNYDNFRFSDDTIFKEIETELNEATLRHFLTKSDEWIYEKEHRSILPYKAASLLKVINEDAVYIEENGDSTTVKSIIISGMLSGQLLPTHLKNTYKIIKDKINNGMLSILQNTQNGVIFLVETDIKHIESVYLGCKVPKHIAQELFEKVESLSDGSVKVYQFELSPTRFELIPKQLKAVNVR